MRAALRPLAIAAVIVFSAPALSGCGVNAIPTKEEQARQAWADVEAAYQRRADLIPNLVATVEAAAGQERTVLNEVVNARARATGINLDADDLSDPAALANFQAAQDELSGALSRLLLVVENYPVLQSNQNFLALQNQLEGTENRILIARRDFNAAATAYNTELRTFPGVIWANTIHGSSEPMELFEAAEGSETAPTVRFNTPAPSGS